MRFNRKDSMYRVIYIIDGIEYSDEVSVKTFADAVNLVKNNRSGFELINCVKIK